MLHHLSLAPAQSGRLCACTVKDSFPTDLISIRVDALMQHQLKGAPRAMPSAIDLQTQRRHKTWLYFCNSAVST
jgi:hypothetical protein